MFVIEVSGCNLTLSRDDMYMIYCFDTVNEHGKQTEIEHCCFASLGVPRIAEGLRFCYCYLLTPSFS